MIENDSAILIANHRDAARKAPVLPGMCGAALAFDSVEIDIVPRMSIKGGDQISRYPLRDHVKGHCQRWVGQRRHA
jgi:hypothetical protein